MYTPQIYTVAVIIITYTLYTDKLSPRHFTVVDGTLPSGGEASVIMILKSCTRRYVFVSVCSMTFPPLMFLRQMTMAYQRLHFEIYCDNSAKWRRGIRDPNFHVIPWTIYISREVEINDTMMLIFELMTVSSVSGLMDAVAI